MKKGLLYILNANILSLIISLVTNFLLPKYLSMDTYAYIKEYTLYIGYAGFFSLGYNDGMYLKYGGKQLSKIKSNDLANNLYNYLILEIVIFAIILIPGVAAKNFMMCSFAFGMLSTNILGYLKSLFQSTGTFELYSSANNLEKLLVFLITIIFLLALNLDNYQSYIISQIFIGYIISALMVIILNRKVPVIFKGRFQVKEFYENISSGIVLMLGNFSNILFTGIDRLFVNFFLTSVHFAQYSFAVSMENLINTFLTPITIYMYNYFCRVDEIAQIIKIKKWALIWGFLIIGAAFPAKFVLENYLTNYLSVSSVMFILFAAQVFFVIIKGIYVNIYKAKNNQSIYLQQMILMLILAVFSNAIMLYYFRNMQVIAMATLFTSIVWFFICEFRRPDLRFHIKEYLYILALLSVYLLAGSYINSIIGFFIYYFAFVILSFAFFKDTIIQMIKSIIPY